MFRTCWIVLLVAVGVSAAPVPKAEVDPKGVELPLKSYLEFMQGKWQIHRNKEPLPRRPEDNTDRWILRYYLGPVGAKSGRLVYEAECNIFNEMRPKWVADDRSVLFASPWSHAWYDPQGEPVRVTAQTTKENLRLPVSKNAAHLHVANSFGAVVQVFEEVEHTQSNQPLYFVPLKGTTFDTANAVRLSDDYPHSFEWNIQMDGPRIAWGEGLYDVRGKTKWTPLPTKRKPELMALSGDTVVCEARTGKGDEKEVIAFDIPTRKELSIRSRKPNEVLVAAQDRVGLFFRSTGVGDKWEVFAADLTDAPVKELAVEAIGDHKSLPQRFVSRDGLHVLVKGEYQLVRWPAKTVK
jgi:hypothetical protein